ncbi:MAG: hypothetical protein MI702_14075, partial [Chlorobiales bacterium]|nr:hypothetical protein [Chlorobiales bacterium]
IQCCRPHKTGDKRRFDQNLNLQSISRLFSYAFFRIFPTFAGNIPNCEYVSLDLNLISTWQNMHTQNVTFEIRERACTQLVPFASKDPEVKEKDCGEPEIELNLPARIALIDSGTPKTAVAAVQHISPHDAIVDVSHSLHLGEKIGFHIECLNEDLSGLFNKTGMVASSFEAIKTRAVVDEILGVDGEVEGMRVRIRFVGNMRFIESNALAEAD